MQFLGSTGKNCAGAQLQSCFCCLQHCSNQSSLLEQHRGLCEVSVLRPRVMASLQAAIAAFQKSNPHHKVRSRAQATVHTVWREDALVAKDGVNKHQVVPTLPVLLL